jgi:hypothetical protein
MSHPSQAQDSKGINSFKRIFLEKKGPWNRCPIPTARDHLGKYFPRFNHPSSSEATVAMIQGAQLLRELAADLIIYVIMVLQGYRSEGSFHTGFKEKPGQSDSK